MSETLEHRTFTGKAEFVGYNVYCDACTLGWYVKTKAATERSFKLHIQAEHLSEDEGDQSPMFPQLEVVIGFGGGSERRHR